MEKTTIKLRNGQILSSGLDATAIVSLRMTRAVNSDTELCCGAVCAAMAEILLITEDACPISQADTFTLFRGNRQVGVFVAEKPQWVSAHRVKIVAYDLVTLLDRDLSQWLKSLSVWPATLRELAEAVCQACNVTLSATPFPNENFPVRPFTGSGITGRRILSFIAQAAGRFCRADEEGVLHFDWYQEAGTVSIGPDSRESENSAQSGQIRHHYYQGSLELADYETAPVEKVQIRQGAEDIGTMYPDIGPANTYIIEGNPLLSADTGDMLQPIAQTLFEQLKQVRYTPCTVKIPADTQLRPGHIVNITDSRGKTVTAYLMESCLTGATETFKCIGTAKRDSVSALHRNTLEALSGRVLRLQTDVEGLRAENADADGRQTTLALTVEGLQSKVSAQNVELEGVREQLTTLRQEKDGLQLQVQTIQEQGVDRVITTTGYRFSEEGLQISKSGLEMENHLDHTGMRVKRGNQVILQADNRGVEAWDVTVGNYLVVGKHARLEDYNGGTACFFV